MSSVISYLYREQRWRHTVWGREQSMLHSSAVKAFHYLKTNGKWSIYILNLLYFRGPSFPVWADTILFKRKKLQLFYNIFSFLLALLKKKSEHLECFLEPSNILCASSDYFSFEIKPYHVIRYQLPHKRTAWFLCGVFTDWEKNGFLASAGLESMNEWNRPIIPATRQFLGASLIFSTVCDHLKTPL